MLQFLEENMTLAPIAVFCIFGNQYITGRVLPYSVTLDSKFLLDLMLVLIISSLYSCDHEYVKVEFLFFC